MPVNDEAAEWETARQLLPQWRSSGKKEVVASCEKNIRLLTKLLVLLDQEERQDLIERWSSQRHRRGGNGES